MKKLVQAGTQENETAKVSEASERVAQAARLEAHLDAELEASWEWFRATMARQSQAIQVLEEAEAKLREAQRERWKALPMDLQFFAELALAEALRLERLKEFPR